VSFSERSGWDIAKFENDPGFRVVRVIQRPLHTAVLEVSSVYLPGRSRESDAAFLSAAKEFVEASKVFGEVQTRSAESQPGRGRWSDCLGYLKNVTVIADPRFPNEPLEYDLMGYVCRHPTSTDAFVKLDYSERHKLGERNSLFGQRATAALDQFRFAEVRSPQP
jgi:hypothetical protein